jgi:hypothetical protein
MPLSSRSRTILTTATLLPALALITSPAHAQDTTATRDSLARAVGNLERTLDSLRTAVDRQTDRLMELDERTAGRAPAAGAEAEGAVADTGQRELLSGLGIRGKPFVKRFGRGTALGGYVSMAYINDIDGHTSTFDQQRMVPFIYAEITDRLHFGTEIEFEHAAGIEVEDGEAEGAGEVKVEFATIDYRIYESLNVRGGFILVPLGRFNLLHDDPINELTDRPLFNRLIVHSALSQTGVGLYGTLYPSERSLLSYELYLVNGYTGDIITSDGLDLSEGPGISEADNNNAKSVVGRLAFSPFLGLELGASAETGRYASADGDFTGDEGMTVWVLDGTWQHGRVDLLGEYGQAHADLPASLAGTGYANDQRGYYAEGHYHFGHGILPPRATSIFTGVLRWDHVDLASGIDGGVRERFTVGVNWRPVGDAVLKTGFQWNWDTPQGQRGRGPANQRLLVSMATYF